MPDSCFYADKVIHDQEAGAKEIPEDKMVETIISAMRLIRRLCKVRDQIIAECGKPKSDYQHYEIPQELNDALYEICPPEEMETVVFTDDKQTRENNVAGVRAKFEEKYGDNTDWMALVDDALYRYEEDRA